MELFRLDEVLVNDKFSNISEVARLLEHEITPILRNYITLSSDVIVRYKKCIQYLIIFFRNFGIMEK